MAGSGFKIEVRGLKEFVKALKGVDKEHPKELRKLMNRSAQIIVDEARPRIPQVTGTAAGSVKARSTQRTARVVGGGNRAPYYGWLDFGGWGGRNKKVHRPFYREGRFIYAAFYENREDVLAELELSLRTAAANAGLKVE